MPRSSSLVCLICLACLAAPVAGQSGRLDRVRREVRAPDPVQPEQAAPSASSSSSDDDDSDDSPLGWLLLLLFAPDRDADEDDDCRFLGRPAQQGSSIGPIAYVLFSPFTVPCTLLDDRWDEDHYFPPYPYRKRYPGYCTIHPRMGEEVAEYWGATCLKSTGLQVTLENGNDFSGLNRFGGAFVLDSTSRLGIVAHWDWFHESPRHGPTDDLLLGDVNATLTFARTHWGQMRTGMGLRWLADGGHADFGFNFHYGGDFFPLQPLVLSTSLDAGTLGDAGFLRLRGTLGVARRRLELFGGYDYISIGGVDLQGPLVGVRFWY